MHVQDRARAQSTMVLRTTPVELFTVLRVADLSKPIEAESKLGSAPVDPSEF